MGVERNPYRIAHKVIRARLFETCEATGHTDFRSDRAIAALRARLQSLAELLGGHARFETDVIHPIVGHGAELDDITAKHVEVNGELERLLRAIDQLASTAPDQRCAVGYELYLRMCRFAAEFIDHAHYEETALLEAMRKRLDVDQFRAIARAEYAQLSAGDLRAMLPALNADDLELLFSDLSEATGADAARALLDAVRGELTADALDRVTAALSR